MTKPERKRGFQTMDPNRIKEVASQGGRTAHQNGGANEFTSEAASKAANARWAKYRAQQQQLRDA